MDEEGYYVLTTGERRWRGACLLRDRNEYPARYDNKVPCVIRDPVKIELPLNDEDKEDFAILVTNQYRVETDAILYMEMLQWKRIISNLKKAGVEYLPKELGRNQEVKLKGRLGFFKRQYIANTNKKPLEKTLIRFIVFYRRSYFLIACIFS